MSITKTYTAWCDVKGCREWIGGGGVAGTAAEMRAEANRYGWVCRNSRDLCPKHKGT